MDNDEIADRLRELIEEIESSVSEMEDLIGQSGNEGALSRAQAYWIQHIKSSLQTTGFEMCTAKDTIEEILGDAKCTLCQGRISEDEAVEHMEDCHRDHFKDQEEIYETVGDLVERIER